MKILRSIKYGTTAIVTLKTIASIQINYIISENNLTSDPTKQKNIHLKHRHSMVEQAYRDMGFQGPVYVQFEKEDTTRTMGFYSKKGYSAIVCIPQGQNHLYLSPHVFSAEMKFLYASSGHEAAHVVQQHLLIKAFFAGSLISLNPFLGLFFILMTYRGPLNQLFEIACDVHSAIKLGTAKESARMYEGQAIYLDKGPRLWHDRLISTHPTAKDRKKCFDKIANKTSDKISFFQSKTNKIISEMILEEKTFGVKIV